MKREVIEQSVQLWGKEPDKAKVSPVVKARSEGAQAVVEAGSFSWQSDLPPTLGGENKAASPTALLLGALAGCAVAFIRDTLAPQLGVRVDAVRAEVRCRADFRGLLGMPGATPDLGPRHRHRDPVARERGQGAAALRGLAGALSGLPGADQAAGRQDLTEAHGVGGGGAGLPGGTVEGDGWQRRISVAPSAR